MAVSTSPVALALLFLQVWRWDSHIRVPEGARPPTSAKLAESQDKMSVYGNVKPSVY